MLYEWLVRYGRHRSWFRTALRDDETGYKPSDLMSQMDPDAKMPDDIQAWRNMQPVGKEICWINARNFTLRGEPE